MASYHGFMRDSCDKSITKQFLDSRRQRTPTTSEQQTVITDQTPAMANFLGLPLRIEFLQGGHVEGILAAIDGTSGTLTVENATRTQPNGRSTQVTVLVIPRDKIANLSLLSVTLNGAAEVSCTLSWPLSG